MSYETKNTNKEKRYSQSDSPTNCSVDPNDPSRKICEVQSYFVNCPLHTHYSEQNGRRRHHRCVKSMQLNQPNERIVLLRLRWWILQGKPVICASSLSFLSICLMVAQYQSVTMPKIMCFVFKIYISNLSFQFFKFASSENAVQCRVSDAETARRVCRRVPPTACVSCALSDCKA